MSTTNYMTIVDPVFELTLIGSIEAAPWLDLLQSEQLPGPDRQQLICMLSAVDGIFRGIRFQELSISIQLAENEYYLAHAFNSRWLFALSERHFFRTPYYPASIELTPRSLTVSRGNQTLLAVSLPEAIRPESTASQVDEIRVRLPRQLRRQDDTPHYFQARLEGQTERYAPDGIHISISAGPDDSVFSRLQASQFRLTDCMIRPRARHSKSKTYFQPR